MTFKRCDPAQFQLSTLWKLAAAVLVGVASGIALGRARWPVLPDGYCSVVSIVAAGAVVAWCGYLLWPDHETFRAIAVIFLAAATTAAAIVALGWPDRPFLWWQFLIVVSLFSVALFWVAPEWNRRTFVLFAIGIAGLLLAAVVRDGYSDVAEKRVTEPVEQAFTDRDLLRKQFDEKDTTITEEDIAAAKQTALEDLKNRVNDVSTSPQLSHEGNLLIRDLGSAAMGARLTELLLVPADTTGVDITLVDNLRTSAQKAVDAYEAQATNTKSPDLDNAIVTACWVVRRIDLDPPSCREVVTDADQDLPEPKDALHQLAIEVVAYRFQVTGSDADKATLDQLTAADPTRLDISLWSAMSAGPEAIVASTGHHSLRPVPGPVGWGVVALLATIGLRLLLRTNSNQLAGPVRVDYTGTSVEELRVAVHANLDAPGTAPGSIASQSITDLAALADPTATGWMKALSQIPTLFAPSQGYVVNADLISAKEASTNSKTESTSVSPQATDATSAQPATPAVVLVRITTASGDKPLDSARFEDTTEAKAVRSAGYWAAGTLLARSTRIPSWAAWNQRTADALATASANKPTRQELERAVREAPDSGILLLLLANRLQLDDEPRAALLMYARCVEAHPRYLSARYRLAVGIGMFAEHFDKQLDGESSADRKILVDALSRATTKIGVDAKVLNEGNVDADTLKVLACSILQRNVDDLRWRAAIVAFLRRSDRDLVNRPGRSDPALKNRRWRLRAFSRSAQWAYMPPTGTSEESKKNAKAFEEQVDKDLENWRANWQLFYNKACKQACNDDSNGALVSLETCLTKPDSGQLSRQWAETDPDLQSLHGHPRFNRFLDQLGAPAT